MSDSILSIEGLSHLVAERQKLAFEMFADGDIPEIVLLDPTFAVNLDNFHHKVPLEVDYDQGILTSGVRGLGFANQYFPALEKVNVDCPGIFGQAVLMKSLCTQLFDGIKPSTIRSDYWVHSEYGSAVSIADSVYTGSLAQVQVIFQVSLANLYIKLAEECSRQGLALPGLLS